MPKHTGTKGGGGILIGKLSEKYSGSYNCQGTYPSGEKFERTSTVHVGGKLLYLKIFA